MKTQHKKGLWYLDSGCSRHMTGNKAMFSTLTPKDGGYISFGENKKGKIIGIGSIGKSNTSTIENVLLIDGLKHNFLNIS